MGNIRWAVCGSFLLLAALSSAQSQSLEQWHHADFDKDKILGVSTYKALEMVKGKTPVPVIVAIIDSGTEVTHPDLDNNLWVNEDEIPGNGIDDDKNGYIDDVHGWSFIGGKNGDVSYDNLEFTRVYALLKPRFDGKTADQIAKADKKDYEKYLRLQTQYAERMEGAKEEYQQYLDVIGFYSLSKETITGILGKENYTLEEVTAIQTDDEMTNASREFIMMAMTENFDTQLPAWKEHVESQLNYSYNLTFDSRTIVGDNYNDQRERNYGSNSITGPKAEHGTHVAGIVGAEVGNEGTDGVCPTAKLMIVRCVPNGDERDKDVANAIRYAADNGARIINMSFGKSHSPFKDIVDEAVQYAESKGVLLIHAAGNDARNIDKSENFPNKYYLSGGECKTWIEVGASYSAPGILPADFTNYGKKNVDVFAPGVEINSTMVNKSYERQSGTSMASPVTAGVAAALLAYYPQLSALQVKAILLKSAVSYKNQKVILPGTEKEVKFKKLSRTGAVVNLYEAFQMAEKMN